MASLLRYARCGVVGGGVVGVGAKERGLCGVGGEGGGNEAVAAGAAGAGLGMWRGGETFPDNRRVLVAETARRTERRPLTTLATTMMTTTTTAETAAATSAAAAAAAGAKTTRLLLQNDRDRILPPYPPRVSYVARYSCVRYGCGSGSDRQGVRGDGKGRRPRLTFPMISSVEIEFDTDVETPSVCRARREEERRAAYVEVELREGKGEVQEKMDEKEEEDDDDDDDADVARTARRNGETKCRRRRRQQQQQRRVRRRRRRKLREERKGSECTMTPSMAAATATTTGRGRGRSRGGARRIGGEENEARWTGSREEEEEEKEGGEKISSGKKDTKNDGDGSTREGMAGMAARGAMERDVYGLRRRGSFITGRGKWKGPGGYGGVAAAAAAGGGGNGGGKALSLSPNHLPRPTPGLLEALRDMICVAATETTTTSEFPERDKYRDPPPPFVTISTSHMAG